MNHPRLPPFLRWRLLMFLAASVLISAAVGAGAPENGRKKPKEKLRLTENIVAMARGVFNMTRNPRPYVVFMILDQAENMYPSFWCGKNLSGTATFNSSYDELDESMSLKQKGDFVMQITNAAHKRGMYDVIPGGCWVEGLREQEFKVVVDKVLKPVPRELKESKFITGQGQASGSAMLVLDVTLRGRISVGGKIAPFEGPAVLSFVESPRVFSLQAKFAFPGKALGLEGGKGDNITATLYTRSFTTTDIPDIPSGLNENGIGDLF